MNKLWYSLAFTLLGGSSAIAQDITQKINPQITEDQKIVSEAPVSQPQKDNDAQTIFFTDDSVIDEIEAEQATSTEQTDNSTASINPSEAESLDLLPEDVIEDDEMIAAEIAAHAKEEMEERSSQAISIETISSPNAPQPLILEVADKPIIPIENNSTETKDIKAEESTEKLPQFAPEVLPKPLEDEPKKINNAPEVPEEIMPKMPKEAGAIVAPEALVEIKEETPVISPSLSAVETIQQKQVAEEDAPPSLVPTDTFLEANLEKEVAPKVDPSIKPVEKIIPEAKENKPFTLPSTPNNSRSKGPFALDETAPINSNIMSDTGFAPSLLNKKIGISPEQRAKMMMKQKYDEMDSNGDGVISEEEFVKYKTEEARKIAYEIFKRVDKNDDKNLSVYEYEILMNKMIESYIKAPKPNQTLN